MDINTRLEARVKAQISKFSGIITKSFNLAKRKLIKELIYGIQASKDVKLSNIARSLNERVDLIKTEDRLSRNLSAYDFTDKINEEIARLGGKRVLEDMVIALDLGDIRKKYASSMENLCKIRDGSENEIGNGYWLCKVLGADTENKNVIPLYCESYSQESKNFKSENDVIMNAIDKVSEHVGTRGIWALDRGGDRNILYENFLKWGSVKRFVIRVRERDLIHKGTKKDCKDLARYLPCPYQAKIIRYEDGKEVEKILSYNAVKVRLPVRSDVKMYFVVVKGLGKEPLMLLTNCDVKIKTKESIFRIFEIYLTRWKCEESFRYIKQCYNLEDIRVRSYISIRNIVVIVLAIAYFTSIYLGQNLMLKIMIEKIFILSKRIFGVPSFFNYAIADGLYNLLFPSKASLNLRSHPNTNNFQLTLDFG